MRAVDTAGVLPLPHPVAAIRSVQLNLREDLASEPDARSANMQNAPAADAGLFLVPKVIE